MKKLIVAAAALAAVVASPMLANAQEAYASDVPTVTHQVRAARAQSIPTMQAQQVMPLSGEVQIHTPYDIYVSGQYVGADPDPNVRLQMIRDFNQEGSQ